MRGLHLGAIFALGAAAARDADEPEAIEPLPERPDPIADLTPWPDPSAEEPDPIATLGHLAGMPGGSFVGLPGLRRPGSARPSVVTFTAAERIERAAKKQARKAAKRAGQGAKP
jgi:hypothetical protein